MLHEATKWLTWSSDMMRAPNATTSLH